MLAHGRFKVLLCQIEGRSRATGVWLKVLRAVLGESGRCQEEGDPPTRQAHD